MEEWIKLYSFESQYLADMTKQLLEQCDVKAVVVNAKDSLFLLGDYELYVTKDNEKKAQAIMDEYKGLTKVDSFVMRGPIERLKDELDANGIISVIKVNRNPRYVLDNYELYVENQDVKAVVPYLTGEALKGWSMIKSCYRTTQARFRIEILNQYSIPSIVVKKRDAKFMKSEINIFVKDEQADEAKKILIELEDWTKIATHSQMNDADIQERLLGKEGIKAIIEDTQGQYSVYVETEDLEEAENIINENRKWRLLDSCSSPIEADYTVAILDNYGIDAITVTKSDITLNIDISVYVEEFQIDEAMEILENIRTGENE